MIYLFGMIPLILKIIMLYFLQVKHRFFVCLNIYRLPPLILISTHTKTYTLDTIEKLKKN